MSDNENRPTSTGGQGKPEKSFTTNNVRGTYDSADKKRISESNQNKNSQKKNSQKK